MSYYALYLDTHKRAKLDGRQTLDNMIKQAKEIGRRPLENGKDSGLTQFVIQKITKYEYRTITTIIDFKM